MLSTHHWFLRPQIGVVTMLVVIACRESPAPLPPPPPPLPPPPAASDGLIYFHWDRFDGTESAVYSIRPDGTGMTRFPHLFDRVATARVNATGEWLAFSESGDVLVTEIANPANIRDVTREGLRIWPLVSPDGQWVANVRLTGQKHELYITRTDQSWQEKVIAASEEFALVPVDWFPGSDSLIYREAGGGVTYITQRDGSRRQPVIAAAQGRTAVSLSPDGRYLAAGGYGLWPDLSSRSFGIWDLLTGSKVREIELPHVLGLLTWSPDRRFLAHVWAWLPPGGVVPPDLEVIEAATGRRWVILDESGGGVSYGFPRWVR